MTRGTLIIVAGPTAVGKTAFSLALAERLGCPIISADSRQFYREMPIGTSAPSPEVLHRVPHYMVGITSIRDSYTVSRYEEEVIPLLEGLFLRFPYVILSGGSMLYIDAIEKGIDEMPSVVPEVRETLRLRFEKEGLSSILEELKLVDPEYYNYVDRKNHKRVIHGLEMYYSTGKPFSFFRTGKVKQRSFSIKKVLLDRPRQELYEAVNSRTLKMFKSGWLAEARQLYPFRTLNALNTIGYKEIFSYFDACTALRASKFSPHPATSKAPLYDNSKRDEEETTNEKSADLEEVIRKIQCNTRDYARKQIIWFRRDPSYILFSPEGDIETLFPKLGISL